MQLVGVSVQDPQDWGFLSKKIPGCQVVDEARKNWPNAVVCANYHKIMFVGSERLALPTRWYRECGLDKPQVSELVLAKDPDRLLQRALLLDLLEEYPGDYPVLICLAEDKLDNRQYFEKELSKKDFGRVRFE
jgi:hypothetical protein